MVTPALTPSRHEVDQMIPSRRSNASLAAALAALLAVSAACGGSSPSTAAAKSERHAALSTGANCTGTSGHEKHINLFACVTCHPKGAAFGFDVPYTFSGGTTTAGGTLVLHTDTAPANCTVACHFPKGAPSKSIAWNTPGPLACTDCHATSTLPAAHPPVAANATRSDCQVCHVMSGHLDGTVTLAGHSVAWSTPADPSNQGFHAYAANAGLSACQACHGQDLAGGAAGVACGLCHDRNLPQGIASWKVNCVMCHGGTDSQTGAPPVATWGNGGDTVRVGAHTRHGAGSAIAPAFDCGVCHTKPADALSTDHVDGGTAEVIFAGIAAAGAPTWNRAVGTCAVYCHGATLNAGGTNTSPSWTGGPVACGDCHGTPPPPPHPSVADLTGCATCHPQTMDATGAIIAPSAGGKHLDGIVEASGTHAQGWMDTSSANFHAYSANRGLAACQGCHGTALDGVGGMVAIGCNTAQCHGATWKTNCTMCHGGADNVTGAPPRATWGSTSAVAVGAHTSHVGPNPISGAFGCNECHAKPTDALSPDHIGGSAVVSFAGPVSGLKGGTWSYPATGTATCSSTYCHGNFDRGVATNTPSWNGTNQAACGTCHATRPLAYLHNKHQQQYFANPLWPWWPLPGGSAWVTCDQCHFGIAQSVSSSQAPTLTVVGGSGPSLHVDGKVDVVFKGGGTYGLDDLGQGTCSAMVCHPGETKSWPR